jgi:hypothetical protein
MDVSSSKKLFMDPLGQACPTFFVVQAALAKFDLYAPNMNFNT